MSITDKKEKQIKLLQQNLRSIRQIVGWTTEQLGNEIGVTKQTISDLETIKRPMTLTQYLAIRSVFNDEIENNPDNATAIQNAIDISVDKGAELDDEKNLELKETLEATAALATKGKKGEALEKMLIALTTPAVVGALVALGAMLFSSTGVGTAKITTNAIKKIIK